MIQRFIFWLADIIIVISKCVSRLKICWRFLLENFLTVHMKIDNITVLYNTVIKRDSEKEAEKEMRNLEESATQQKILEAANRNFMKKDFRVLPLEIL